jgi:hypothetical protein
MTPAQQAQQEYIITEEQLESIFHWCIKRDIEEAIRSRPHTPAPETALPHIPHPCEYLYIEGMNAHCQDSYSPSRVDCHHCVNWRCWDITNIRESTIAAQVREEAIDDCLTALNVAIANRSFTDTDGDYHMCPALTKGEIRSTIQSIHTPTTPKEQEPPCAYCGAGAMLCNPCPKEQEQR